MGPKERLKVAFENVGLLGDSTWLNIPHAYQEANKKAYSREMQLRNYRVPEERPRTVKDLIPNSRLAKYADYEYDEARELCYTRYIQKTPFEFLSENMEENCDEPWLLPDVDVLFLWFVCCQNRTRNDYGAFELCDEHGWKQRNVEENVNIVSPLLNAKGFEEKKLKLGILSEKAKSSWKSLGEDLERTILHQEPYHYQKQSEPSHFDHLEDFQQSFNEQTNWVSKCELHLDLDENEDDDVDVEDAKDADEKTAEKTTPEQASKRLYSAVLQGLNTTESLKKAETSSETSKNDSTLLSSIKSVSTFTILNAKTQHRKDGACSTSLNKVDVKIQKNTLIQAKPTVSHRGSQSEETAEETTLKLVSSRSCLVAQQPQQFSYNNYNYYTNSTTYTQKSQIIARNIQYQQSTFLPAQYHHHHHHHHQYTQPVFMVQQNRYVTPVQQPYYLQPLQHTRMMQRWIVPQNYQPRIPQYVTPWIGNPQQPQVLQQYKKPTTTTTSKNDKQQRQQNDKSSTTSTTQDSTYIRSKMTKKKDAKNIMNDKRGKILDELEELVKKTVNWVLEDEPVDVTATVSEELELQALEQYSSSSDNVYQELERQAAEQYEERECSEA